MQDYALEEFHAAQLASWPEARERFAALSSVMLRRVGLPDGSVWTLQCNPSRAVSSSASTDAASIAARPCFLCRSNRADRQISIVDGRFELLVNPFPIFDRHFVIASIGHTPQTIRENIASMLHFASMMPGYAVFYNGPRCGASAPDHLHFQAVDAAALPLLRVRGGNDVGVKSYGPVGFVSLQNSDQEALASQAAAVIEALGGTDGEEPMVNIIAEGSRLAIVPRRCHRPARYFDQSHPVMFSPASIDVSGVAVLPRPSDFRSLSGRDLSEMLSEVCLTKTEINSLLYK